MRCAYFNPGQLGLHCSQLGPLFLGAALQLGQLALALKIIEGFLACSHPFSIGYSYRLCSNLQSIAQRGVVQRYQ